MSISSKKAGFIRCCLGLDKHCSLHLTFINSILTKQLGPIVSLLTIIPATVDSYSLAQAEPLRLSRRSQPLGLDCSAPLPIRVGMLFINLCPWTLSSRGSLGIDSHTALCRFGAVIVQQGCFSFRMLPALSLTRADLTSCIKLIFEM